MRYIVNANNYITTISFGCYVECQDDGCTEYTGSVPTGYTSLEDWYADEAEKLYRWKIVNGQLTLDTGAAAPRDKTIFDLIYPVGSVYISVNPVSPADLFGGTWKQIQDTFLLAAGMNYEAGTTGGEAEHTLTIEEMPSHNHGINGAGRAGTDSGDFGSVQLSSVWAANYSAEVGGGGAHNNMPPYLAVYMWQRTA